MGRGCGGCQRRPHGQLGRDGVRVRLELAHVASKDRMASASGSSWLACGPRAGPGRPRLMRARTTLHLQRVPGCMRSAATSTPLFNNAGGCVAAAQGNHAPDDLA